MLRGLIVVSGLSLYISTSYQFINKVVVSAFVERWYLETNTFHTPFGEMTITHNVSALQGTPVVGRSISLPIERLPNRDAIIPLVSEKGK